NDLTFVPNFMGGGAAQSVGIGDGIDPVAIVGDFNHDGISDLLVGSSEPKDGLYSFVLGTADGPALAASIRKEDAVQPSDLALARQQPGFVELYATDLIADRVLPVILPFTEPKTDLVQLQNTDFAVVATLTVGTDADRATSDQSANAGQGVASF